MNERFNTPEEVSAFLNRSEFVDGLKKYLNSLLEDHQTESRLSWKALLPCYTRWLGPSRQMLLSQCLGGLPLLRKTF